LVLLDLLLPGMSGIELCRRLRKEPLTRSMPVVIVSAKASEKEIVTSQELGVHHYIIKPFSVREVVACVNSILGEKQLVRADR
jgi:DNA-binding response OmpR family regulator